MRLALVRDVPASFASALCAAPPEPPIDVAMARAQHAAYVAALAALGLEIVSVPADEACPDCCFIEDTAVVVAGAALLARPGAPARRGEVPPVAGALGRAGLALHTMAEPATLDGGDVLRVGRTLYAGLSARTSAAGAARLREVFAPRGLDVVTVDTPARTLHLKSVCSALADDLILVVEGTLDPALFRGARVLPVPAGEAHAANVVAFGGAALVAHDAPRTLDLVAAAGVRPVPVDTSELRKADGALTCLSILVVD